MRRNCRQVDGYVAARAGSAAASAPVAPSRLRHGCRDRAARPGSACSPSPGSPLPTARSAPQAWHRSAACRPCGDRSTGSGPAAGASAATSPASPADTSAAAWQPPGQGGDHHPVCPVQPGPRVLPPQHRDLLAQIGWDRGRGFDVASVRFPRSPRRTRRATLIAPGAPRVLPCRQSLGAAGGSGVHGVGMLPPR